MVELHEFLSKYLYGKRFKFALEFGSGKSTLVLTSHCDKVVTIDKNEKAYIDPKPNVIFKNEDMLKIVFDFEKPDLIVFDLGNTEYEKYLYRIAFERLVANNILDDKAVLILDNCNMDYVKDFINYLNKLGYIIIYEGRELTCQSVMAKSR